MKRGQTARQGSKEVVEKQSEGLWKKVVMAAVGLVLSIPFINAAIPRYKLQIESPAFKKDGIYEASEGAVVIKWKVSKEQWFHETDINGITANVALRTLDDGKEMSYLSQMGEFKRNLRTGKYEVRIDAAGHGRSETIALQVVSSASPVPTPTKIPVLPTPMSTIRYTALPTPTPTPTTPSPKEIGDWVRGVYPNRTVFGQIQPVGQTNCVKALCQLRISVTLIDSAKRTSNEFVTATYRTANGKAILVQAIRN